MNYSTRTSEFLLSESYLATLIQNNLPGWQQEKIKWYYYENPFGKAVSVQLLVDSKTVVGTESIFPREFCINNNRILAGNTGDFVIDQKHRFLAPALILQKSVISTSISLGFQLLYGLPNKKALPVKLKAGFTELGKSTPVVKLIRSEKFLDKIFDSTLLKKLLLPFSNFFLKMTSKENYRFNSTKYKVEILATFDNRFDNLWENAKKKYHVIAQRDSNYLNWRFIQCPYSEYQIFALTDSSSSEIIGYFVYIIENDQVKIVDFLSMNLNQAINNLIVFFLKYIRKSKYQKIYINYLGASKIVDFFKKYGFKERGQANTLIIRRDIGIECCNIYCQENWHLTEADIDQ